MKDQSRVLVATSHEGKYSYWMAPDRYVYQRNEIDQSWIGWLCAQSSWESTFSKSEWMEVA